MDRLLSNRGVDVWTFFAYWTPYIIGARSEVVVALDWTSFAPDGQETIVLSMLTGHGRATPLLWKTVASSTLKGNQRRYEYEVLCRLREVLPEGVKVTVVADRGFADCKLFYALTTELGFEYGVRLFFVDAEQGPLGLWEASGGGFWERRSEEVSDPSKVWWREVARRGTDRAERQYYPISTSLGVRTRRCSALRGSAPTQQDRDWLVAGASEPPRLQPDASVPWATPSDHGLRRCHRRRSDTCGACPGVGQLDDDAHYHAVTSTSYTAAVARSSGVWAPPMRASGAQAALSHRSSSPGGLQARVPASAQ